jgi:hypothetical protein
VCGIFTQEKIQMPNITKKITASVVISDIQGSDKYLSIRGKLCDTKTNLNGVRVTEAFIDEIVANEDDYHGIPLCADVRGLLNNKKIGHMYNKSTGEFMSSIIGSMQSFERADSDDGVVSLVFTARVMKRYSRVCEALTKLFAEGKLKFSFEVCCGEYTVDEDGTFIVDADPANYLEGAAVVTLPACEDAVALELVAECLGERGETDMNINVNAEETEVKTEEVEVSASEAETVNAEDEVHEDEQINVEAAQTEDDEEEENKTDDDGESEDNQDKEKDDDEKTAASKKKCSEEEMAEVIVDISHSEREEVSTYDTDTGIRTYESVVQNTNVCGPASSMTSTNVAESEVKAESSDSSVSAESESNDDDKECTDVSAESVEEIGSTMIAQILEKLEKLDSRIGKIEALAESISQHEDSASESSETVNAEAETVEAQEVSNIDSDDTHITAEKRWTLVNPFTSSIQINTKKYTLLEEEKPKRTHYTLL